MNYPCKHGVTKYCGVCEIFDKKTFLTMNTNYELEVMTDQYTGNFHRELDAYLFGFEAHYDEDGRYKKYVKASQKAWKGVFKKNDDDNADAICELLDHQYDEYGQCISYLSSFKGSGVGTQGITYRFLKDPTNHLPLIEKILLEFPEFHIKNDEMADLYKGKVKSMKIISIRLIEKVITEAEVFSKKF